MRSRVTLPLIVLLGSVYVAWLGFGVQTMGDYPSQSAPAMNALLSGRFAAFFDNLPANGTGGSLILRAPAALLGKLLIGSQHAIFRFGSLLCVLSLGALAVWLARDEDRSARSRIVILGLLVSLPLVLDAVRYGHPEEALGCALCVAAVLLAARGRASLAGVALGLAIVNKPWGALAIAPSLLAARERRWWILASAAMIAGSWTTVTYLVSPDQFARIAAGANNSVVAHPPDLWWPLARLRVAEGVTPAYFAPGPLGTHARELALLLSIPLSLPLARRRERCAEHCLALLAALFLMRCILDPSNHIYYQLPLVVALASFELEAGDMPVLALAATAAFWLVFHTISGVASLDLQFVAYLCVALPIGAFLLRPATGMTRPLSAVNARHRLSPA